MINFIANPGTVYAIDIVLDFYKTALLPISYTVDCGWWSAIHNGGKFGVPEINKAVQQSRGYS